MTDDSKDIICDFVDLVMPDLTPYESSLYLLLLRLSFFANTYLQVRVGKKRVAMLLGKSARAAATISFAQVTEVFKGLEEKGCITIGDTMREGTLYTIVTPREIPFVKEKLAAPAPIDDNYFTIPENRRILFERDEWTCQYCGGTLSTDNATLDHYIPQSKGGSHSKENLRTCCFVCNAIKSGKSFEEAAPFLLKSMQERRQRIKQ